MNEDNRETRQSAVSPELIAGFAEAGFDPVEVTIADMVTLRMDGNYRVLEVSLSRRTAEDDASARHLEGALVEAFNEAVRQVVMRNGERLARLLAQSAQHSDRPEGGASGIPGKARDAGS